MRWCAVIGGLQHGAWRYVTGRCGMCGDICVRGAMKRDGFGVLAFSGAGMATNGARVHV